MKSFLNFEVDRKYTFVLIAWVLVIWFAFAFFWQGSADTFLFGGSRGLLNPWVSGPLFFFSVYYAVVLSVPKLYGPATLFTGAGVLLTSGVCLSLYVSNSGFLIPWFAGCAFFKEGRRITLRLNRTLEDGAQVS